MTMLRLSVIPVFLAIVSGCTATNLSQLNSSYDALIDKVNAPTSVSDGLSVPSAPDSNKTTVEAQQGQEGVQARFGALAQDAYTVGGKASEPATQIAAYRLAGLAAWQHHPSAPLDSLVQKAQNDGMAVCAKLGQGPTGAPRDCAILRYLMILITYQELADAMNGLTDATLANLEAIEENWLTKMGGLATEEANAWSDISSGNSPYTGISASTLQYFKAVTFASACLVDIAHLKGEVVSDKVHTLPDKYDDLVATNASQFLPVLKATGLLTDQNATTWFNKPKMDECTGLLGSQAPSALGAE